MTLQRPTTESSSSTGAKSRRRWRFAGSVLDERSLELVVNGIHAELERKPLEVLIYLLQHAGEVCTKDELLAGVWPGRVLSETVLTKSIGRLREVLGDRDQDIIKTAYGFGYRLVAPVQVELAPAVEATRFDFRSGDHPRARPLWTLIERLGVGGHGEAWRGRHEKTHEERVFKFALDEASLGALKREITLFRVINDTLGDAARVVRLLDWNLEHLPYFVEAEYIAGGNLIDWAERRGGIQAIPLAERLEVVAKIAEALAAVHSVGVLHKDLKPSNVLVKESPGTAVDIRLADFGSGGVLEVAQLERLGITRLGFTKAIALLEPSSATPLYLAPEILTGQPFTVKADIYALGVILYQLLCGDFHKVMSPGWERGIDDELLREDIALVAEGNPAMRLADAEVLAQRLRKLDERRAQRAAEREAREKAERSRRLVERARARRFGLMLACAILVVGLATSIVLYLKARQARELTVVAATRSSAVVDFLGKDIFAPISSGTESIKDMDVITLLRRAGDEIDVRFAGQPDIASELHFLIGRSFQSFYQSPLAVSHFHRAMELGEYLDGEGSESALRSAAELVSIDYVLGELRRTIARYVTVLAAGQKRLGPGADAVLELRLRLARGYYLLGEWPHAEQAMQSLLSDVRASTLANSQLAGESELYYGQLLIDLGRPTDAEKQLRAALHQLSSSLGEKHALATDARAALGRALGDSGRYEEAQRQLERAQELAMAWAPTSTWTAIRPRYFMALLFLQRDEPQNAEPILAKIVDYEDLNKAAYLEAHKASGAELDHTAPVRQALGEAYAREGNLPMAVTTLQRAIAVGEVADGPHHPAVISARLSLAECELALGRDAEARAVLESITTKELAILPAAHPIFAQWNRVRGLLAQHERNLSQARNALAATFQIYRTLYGPEQWRTIRAHDELLRVAR